MSLYAVPVLEALQSLAADEIYLITSGDLRLSANQVCWPAQEDVERRLTQAFRDEGIKSSARSLRCGEGPRIYLEPAHGHGCLRRH